MLTTFAIEVDGLDLAAAQAQRGNGLVVVRDQQLTPEQLMAFARRFGDPLPQTDEEQHLPGYPEICVLSNKIVDGKPFGFHKAGRRWHTDGTTLERPGLTTVLYGIEVPPEGGDTWFADVCAAFETLPQSVRDDLEDIRVVHSRGFLMRNSMHHRPELLDDATRAAMREIVHPLVVRRPGDGRKTFYLTAGSAKGIIGMSDEDGRALMRRWIDYATQEQFVHRHAWRAGDVLIWNNVGTLHQATDYDDRAYQRLVYRCWMTPCSN